MGNRAFSLLELAVAVVIIGIIGAIAIPRISGFADRSRIHAASATVRQMQSLVFQFEAENGVYPASVDPAWFADGKIPPNPLENADPRQVEVVRAGAAVTDPAVKTLGAGAPAFWYNSDNGQVRARVPNQGSASATLALYNAVNGTALSTTGASVGSTVVGGGALSKIVSGALGGLE
ncbi:MAG: hypothetical protein Kow0022_06650 [Phycisphaerales bacterium]